MCSSMGTFLTQILSLMATQMLKSEYFLITSKVIKYSKHTGLLTLVGLIWFRFSSLLFILAFLPTSRLRSAQRMETLFHSTGPPSIRALWWEIEHFISTVSNGELILKVALPSIFIKPSIAMMRAGDTGGSERCIRLMLIGRWLHVIGILDTLADVNIQTQTQ